jgi:transcriptional regulator GlxA family with amidase domain
MARKLIVALVCFPGIQILDVTGPASVFGAANMASGRTVYDIQLVSAEGGPVRSSCGVTLETKSLTQIPAAQVDMAFVAGGESDDIQRAMTDKKLKRWMQKVASTSKRFGSICTGTFLLAAFGLVSGRSVATHWSAVDRLARLFPDVRVDAEALFVVDGALWTSAGVTTAIDMTLAMVEKDLGADIASEIAQRLVLYARRPGNQSQFSPLLIKKAASDHDYAALILWMQQNIDKPLDVATLAARASQSVRTFHRKFSGLTGQTPADFVEALRLDQARSLLDHKSSLKVIAAQSGFGSVPRFKAAFQRRFNITPAAYRVLHLATRA